MVEIIGGVALVALVFVTIWLERRCDEDEHRMYQAWSAAGWIPDSLLPKTKRDRDERPDTDA